MKIKPQDYDKLKKLLDEFIEHYGAASVKKCQKEYDNPKRFRWVLFRSAKIKIGDGKGVKGDIDLYSYMDDSHIDTALKHYVDNCELLK